MKKTLLAILLVVTLMTAVFAVGSISVSAAPEAGTLTSNAIKLTDGKWYTKYWTNSNYNLNCYNKIVVPSRGYITFTAEKPFDDEGEVGSYGLTLYNTNGTVVWAASTSAQRDSFGEYYTYKIGLAAGTYYMNIDPSFYVYSGAISSSYKYTFTKTSYWEVEGNNTKATATQMTLGKKYTGVYTDESYSTSYNDYYKVKLTKGKYYRLIIGNYTALDAGTTIEKFYGPSGNTISLYDMKESGNSYYLQFKASATGWYYFALTNDGNDAGVQYNVTVKEHIKKTQTIKGPDKITVYGLGEFDISKKYSAKTTLSYSENSSILYLYYSEVDPSDCGTATITIKAKETDHYKAATKKVTIVVNPAKPTFKSVANTSRGGLKVKFDNSTYDYDKTQIQIATNSKFTKGVKTYTADKYDSEKTITNLKANTKYYVRIRNMASANGKKYYSKWSTTLSKKVTVSVPTVATPDPWSWSKGTLEVDWDEVTGVTGYQVQVATNSKFTQNMKSKTITGNTYDDREYEFSKLKAGKKYYVRVRAYVKTGGKTYYGKWSKVKSTTVDAY